MTPARTKSKTLKKKPAATKKKKPAAKRAPAKKPPRKAPPPKTPRKKSAPAKVETKPAAAKKDVKKLSAPTIKSRPPHPLPQSQREDRAKKAPKVRQTRGKDSGKRPDLPLPTPVERPATGIAQLGEKYVCFKCGAKFYDLGRPEPLCPKCGADQREAPRQARVRAIPPPEPAEIIEEKPPKRSRLLDEDDEEIVLDAEPDTDDLDLGLGVVDDGDDFGAGPDDEVEEEEEEPL